MPIGPFNTIRPNNLNDPNLSLETYCKNNDININNKRVIWQEDERQYFILEHNELQAYISQPNAHYHEVIFNRCQRIRFDVDAKYNVIDQIKCVTGTRLEKMISILNLLIDAAIATFRSLYQLDIGRDYFIITNSSGESDSKYSYHIVMFPYTMSTAEECYEFAKLTTLNFDYSIKQIIDMQVYRSLQNFRLIGSSRANSTRVKRFDAELSAILGLSDSTNPEYTLIQPKTPGTVLPTVLAVRKQTFKLDDMPIEYIEYAKELINDLYPACFIFTSVVNNMIMFRRVSPSGCLIHATIHDSDHIYVSVINRDNYVYFYYRCRRQVSGEQSVEIGKKELGESINVQIEENDTFINKHVKCLPALHHRIAAEYRTQFESLPNTNIYDEPKIRPYELVPTLVVQAQMKMGKTRALRQFIDLHFPISEYQPYKIVLLSARMTFSNSLREPFKDFEIYSDLKEIPHLPMSIFNRIVIQVESMHKLLLDNDNSVDLLVIDEVESVLEQWCSPYHREKLPDSFGKFKYLMQHVPHVLLMDANISDRTYNVLKQLRPNYPITFHKNEHSNAVADHYYFTSKLGQWLNQLEIELKANKKIVIPTNSLKEAKIINQLILDMGDSKRIKPKRILMYTSDTSQSTKVTHFENVGKTWIECDVLIYTPTLSAGVSFEAEHFDMLFGYFNDMSCTVENCRQMMGRVRNLRERKHYLCVTGSGNKYLPTSVEVMRGLIASHRSNIIGPTHPPYWVEYDDNCELKLHESPYAQVFFENQIIINKSRNSFVYRFIDQIYNSRAQIEVFPENPDGYMVSNRRATDGKLRIERATAIANAQELTQEDIKKINDKMTLQDEITEEEKLAQEKYFFRHVFNWTTDQHADLDPNFVLIYNDPKVKRVYRNLCDIKSRNTIEESLKHIQENDRKQLEFANDSLIYKYKYELHSLAQHFIHSSDLNMCGKQYVHECNLYKNYVLLGRYLLDNEKIILSLANQLDIVNRTYNYSELRHKYSMAQSSLKQDVPITKEMELYIKFILDKIINPFIKAMYGLHIVREKKAPFYKLDNDKIGDLFILSKDRPQVLSKLQLNGDNDYIAIDKIQYDIVFGT